MQMSNDTFCNGVYGIKLNEADITEEELNIIEAVWLVMEAEEVKLADIITQDMATTLGLADVVWRSQMNSPAKDILDFVTSRVLDVVTRVNQRLVNQFDESVLPYLSISVVPETDCGCIATEGDVLLGVGIFGLVTMARPDSVGHRDAILALNDIGAEYWTWVT
jgi:hypothetical protein